MRVIAIHRDPFSVSPHVYHLEHGATLAEMARRVTSLPEDWPRHDADAICINGHPVPRTLWRSVRPKPEAGGVPVEVTFHAPPMGGGEGTGKSVLSVVASIALVAVSGGVGSAVSLFAGAAPGTTASILGTASRAALLGKLASGAVMIAGSALLGALAPTPSVPRPQDRAGPTQLGRAGAQGNVLEPNAPLPRVLGTRKVFPPFVAEPLVYTDGQDEVVEAVVALAGPHKLEDIRVGEAPIDELSGVEYETREGWPGLEALELVGRYARTIADQSPLRGHTVSEDDKNQLETNTGKIEGALPQARVLATRNSPDEFWIGLMFAQGLTFSDAPETAMRVPLRLRIRERGSSTWTNLPELHFQAAKVGPLRATIKFAWRDGPVNTSAASTQGWVEARLSSPGQTIDPTTAGWTADSYFDANTGGDHWVTAANAGSNDLINIIMGESEAEFQLDRSVFPPGVYEVEITRGYAFKNSQYSTSTYEIDGSVRDPFHYEGAGAPRIYQGKDGLLDELTILRASSVVNQAPVRRGGVALIAIKARNVRLDQLSVLASGYVRDWGGAAWDDWKTTSNPAPHLVDILAGNLNATPVPAGVLDNQSLLDFRADGWSCNAIIEDQSVGDAARIVAGSGFARLYQSEVFGVARDRDRSADSPVQIFTPQNTADVSWSRGYPKLPNGFRATFADSETDYNARQIIHPPGASRTEQVTIDGLVTEAQVRGRLDYDLAVAKYRSGFYSWNAPIEAIKARRGSLVGLVTDALTNRVFTGRVTDFDLDAAGDVVAVRLDNEPDMASEDDWASITDLGAVGNMALIGATFGLALRRAGKVATTHQVTESARGADWLNLATPATLTGLQVGDLGAVGPLGREYFRLVVADMIQKSEAEWTITAVDEAPQIWQ